MNALINWPLNRLLLALPSANLKRLRPELEHILCQRGQILMDADSPLDHVFFPDSSIVSVVAVYADGSILGGDTFHIPHANASSMNPRKRTPRGDPVPVSRPARRQSSCVSTGRGCSRKKRSISLVASGPRGSV
jgi:hypothetical protein